MKVFCNQVPAAGEDSENERAEPTIYAHYLYDSAGIRLKKVVRKQGGAVEVTESVDGVMERHSASDVQNNTLHVMDTETRIATLRIGQRFPDDGTPSTKYALGDHVGGINTVVGDEGALVNREEYTPYGDTSFGSFARKRYRFTGRERDAESGLYYHWGRYYAPYLATWVSADPAGVIDGCSLYRYAADNPLTCSTAPDETGLTT